MASQLLSRIFDNNSASIYDALREHDTMDASDSELDDLEERAGMLPQRTMPTSAARPQRPSVDRDEDELDYTEPYRQSQLDQPPRHFFPALPGPDGTKFRQYQDDDDDVDVPESLLFEASTLPQQATRSPPESSRRDSGMSGPSTHQGIAQRLTEQWEAATARSSSPYRPASKRTGPQMSTISPKDRALWKWANVEDLDSFLGDVYAYFVGKGVYSILLSRILNLLTLGFVVSFTTFLGLCIDYTKLKTGNHMNHINDIMVEHCMSGMSSTTTLFLWCISFFWVYKLITYVLDIRRLIDLYHFYTYLLEIPDSDMQTVSWQEIVARLMVLRDANPNTSEQIRRRNKHNASKQRMDAHDIANRLMRRENYLIALFNKDILDLTIPLPYLRNRAGILTRTLEWNLSQCVLDFVFNDRGQFRTLFLKDTYRKSLSEGLRRRFIFAGTMNFVFAPFIVTYFLILFLLQNLHDFIKTPAKIGHRTYTPLAEWKFREFNELWHLFQVRLNMSYPAAESYVDQFPKDKTAQAARFVSFVASSLLGVLVIGSIIDYELITVFQIADGINALACMTALTTIYAISRGMIPEENMVYDPEWSIMQVIQHTHYMPDHWKENLHSDDVKRDFLTLYKLKITIFIEELLSLILTPFVLWYSLPKCSDRIIDFIREFTVHVDGVGYVCSFAVFDFQKPGQQKVDDLRGEYYGSKDNKMIASYIGFMDQYHNPQNRGTGVGRRPAATPYHMFSPTLTAHLGTARRPEHLKAGKNVSLPQHSMMRSFHRDGPSRVSASMMRSSLLDHHHQPMTATRGGRNMFHPTTSVSLKEEDEETGEASVLKYKSNLGESFDSTGIGEASEHQHDDGGVLGLLNQFVGGPHHPQNGTGRTGVL